MATITSTIGKEYLDAYDGYDEQEVSLGLVTGLYRSPAYQAKKVKRLAIGLLSDITYAGAEHDSNPLALPIYFNSQYQTLLSYNLHYLPEAKRRALILAVLKMNAARIRNNQPIVIDYHAVKRVVPDSQYIVRHYKTIGINPIKTYSLNEIPDAIKGANRWQNHYRVLKENR